MMFKKKSNLPPRPKFPDTNQIIADITAVTNDDPLFKTSKIIGEKKFKQDNTQEQNDVYQKVQKLFTLHQELKMNMEHLNLMSKGLEERKKDVLLLSKELKEQALNALV